MLITKPQFQRYQRIFHEKVTQVPYKIGLEVITVSPSPEGFSLEAFVGDSGRTSKTYEFRALYEKEISQRTRDKYGLPREVNGTVYLSPKQLTSVFGDYHIDWNTTKVHFEGRVQIIDRVVYLEDFPEYKGCVGVQIFVKDETKGG